MINPYFPNIINNENQKIVIKMQNPIKLKNFFYKDINISKNLHNISLKENEEILNQDNFHLENELTNRPGENLTNQNRFEEANKRFSLDSDFNKSKNNLIIRESSFSLSLLEETD